ncbi:MAG: ecdysteroid 22-kinase family protein [Actinomycetia bacterium]|nr:ecdysteroid 22-kinase family protein [Actinomycetes bacterium]
MTPEQITSTWLSSVFDSDVELTDSKRVGDGLVGMNLRLSLASRNPDVPATVIAKLPSPDPTSRATGIALRNYEREVKFYAEIAPTVDIRLPRCFHGDWSPDDGDFVLLLEDLAPAAQGDQIVGCNEAIARRSVLELARLHGPRWADSALDAHEFLSRTSREESVQLQAIWNMFLPGFLATFDRYLDSEGITLIKRFGERIPDWVEGRALPATVTHGDYRLDNLMYASASGGYPIAVVDWQTPGHGQASGDVSYFMGAGPLPPLRRKIERDVVDGYLAALGEYNVSVSDSDFWHHYCRDAYGGIIMSVVASQVVGVSERSEAMFAAMASRHTQHAVDLGSERLI